MAKITGRLNRGEKLWIFFDTGAFGSTPLVGTVKAAGPKVAVIVWESGLRNRLSWDWIRTNAYAYNGEFEDGN